MEFSVLMSVYIKEQPEFLRQSLDSVFNQTVAPSEVIIVEDGSLTAELYSVLDEYEMRFSQLKRIPLAVNGGLGNALNVGLKHCSYELVARMDSDDISLPDRFEKQLKVFADDPDISVVSGLIGEFNNTNATPSHIRFLPEFHDEIIKYGRLRCPINHPAVMYRKSVVIRVGGYPSKTLFEDYMLWVKLIVNGARFYNIQEVVLYFRADIDMFCRRGGFSYALDELHFQYKIYQLGYISFSRMVANSIMRFFVRIIPAGLRATIYKRFLRHKN